MQDGDHQNKTSLDKSAFVKTLNESKISKKRKNKIDGSSSSRSIASIVSKDSFLKTAKRKNDLQSELGEEFDNKIFNENNNLENVNMNFDKESINLKSNRKKGDIELLKQTILNERDNRDDPDNPDNLSGEFDQNCNLKDISEITQNSNFIIKSSIQNSIFNCNELLPLEKLDDRFAEAAVDDNKILHADYNEEIYLPDRRLKMKGLLITKPVRIIGQPNCVLEILEGPISININENYENELVKFSQVKIVFDICETEKSIIKNYKGDHAKFTVLFRLYPGSLVEIEDCDITCVKDNTIPIAKHKLICFQLMYCKYSDKIEKVEKILITNNKSVGGVSNINNNSNLNPNMSNKLNSESNNNHSISPTILTIISSRIEKFYQTVRSAENCIINIEKSFINKNLGKSLCILNPLIIKVVGSIFEGNGDNAIHLKFVKDDNLLLDSRKLFFKNNEFSYNYGTGVYIDGIENFIFDLDITLENNNFKKNKGDAVYMLDLFVKSMVIKENKFLAGKANGLNLNKILQKNYSGILNQQISSYLNSQNYSNALTATSNSGDLTPIEIKENEFLENEGFGIFMNECKAQIVMNNFFQNRGSGILLISLNSGGVAGCLGNIAGIDSLGNINVNNKQQFNNSNSIDTSHYNAPGTCFISKNSFIKNGGSGIRIINYNNFSYLSECYFKENIEFGVQIEVDYSAMFMNSSGSLGENNQNINIIQNNAPGVNNKNSNNPIASLSSEKIRQFKNSDTSKIPKETNLILHNCTIINNLKSGIYLNNCFIFLENTIISDNLDYAIYTPKEEYRHCFKQSKSNTKNMINGNIGGPWGEISVSKKSLCSSCTSTTKIRRNNINSDIKSDNNKNNINVNANNIASAGQGNNKPEGPLSSESNYQSSLNSNTNRAQPNPKKGANSDNISNNNKMDPNEGKCSVY